MNRPLSKIVVLDKDRKVVTIVRATSSSCRPYTDATDKTDFISRGHHAVLLALVNEDVKAAPWLCAALGHNA